jgi:hypothetical protein
MENEGKYVYCVVGTRQERNFGPIGIGGRGDEVLTVGCDDISMVVSNHPMTRLRASRANMMGHETVIEQMMKEFDSVLPVRFGTIASGSEEVRNQLHRRYGEYENGLKDMDHKVELGVKGIWTDMCAVFNEIVEENEVIRNLRKRLKGKDSQNIQMKMDLGRLVITHPL